MKDVYCCCTRISCLALSGSEKRDYESLKYNPKPLKPLNTKVDNNLKYLALKLARNNHLAWCKEKVANGYKYGQRIDEHELTHPYLLAWEKLPETEKNRNFDNMLISVETILLIG